MRAEPGRALSLLARKLWMFWSDWEYGNPAEPRFFALRFAPWVRFLPIGFGVTAGLAAIGALSALAARNRAALLLAVFVLVYIATVVAFLIGSIELRPDSPDPWFTLGRIEADEGRPDAAFAHFARAYELDPEHFNSAYADGVMALERGERAAGIAALERVVQSDREVPEELRRRAREVLVRARAQH